MTGTRGLRARLGQARLNAVGKLSGAQCARPAPSRPVVPRPLPAQPTTTVRVCPSPAGGCSRRPGAPGSQCGASLSNSSSNKVVSVVAICLGGSIYTQLALLLAKSQLLNIPQHLTAITPVWGLRPRISIHPPAPPCKFLDSSEPLLPPCTPAIQTPPPLGLGPRHSQPKPRIVIYILLPWTPCGHL